jgi:predicted nucleotidyltransferase/predicted transcriptional regulator
MDVSHPYRAISPSIDIEMLISLAASSEARSGRQIAAEIGRSPTGVQHVLARLVEEGLVEQTRAGRAFLYRFNHDHLLAGAVREMADVRVELVNRLRWKVDTWKRPPVHLSMFGSAARGDGDSASDIDLFLVRPKAIDEDDEEWRATVDRLSGDVESWTGNRASIIEIGERELPGLRKRRPAALRGLERDAIDIAGRPARKLLGKRVPRGK